MWVFGYGSLMWDHWETQFGCLRSLVAVLPGYQRVFNKASVRNWGTPAVPGPTLNIMPSDQACRGIAFEFPDRAAGAIDAYLRRREGPSGFGSSRPHADGPPKKLPAMPATA